MFSLTDRHKATSDHRSSTRLSHVGRLAMAGFSATIAAVLLAVLAVRYVENRLIAMAGEGLALSALNLADALNRTVVEAALIMQRLAVDEAIRTADEHELLAYLRRVQSVSAFFPMITVFDQGGRPKASTDVSKVGQIEGEYPKSPSVGSPGIYVFEETLKGREGFTLWAPLNHEAGRFDGAVTMRIVLRDLLLGVPYVIPALLSSPSVHEYQVTGNDGTKLFDSTQGSIPSSTRQPHARASAASMALNRSGYYYVEEDSESGPLVIGYADTNRGDRYAPIRWRISVAKKKAVIVGSFKRDLSITAVGVGMTVGVAAGMVCWMMYRSRKRRDEAERRETWSTQALNRIPYACIVTDTAGTVMFLNESAHALIGWTDKEAQGQPLQDVFKPSHDESGTLRDMMEAIRKKRAIAGKPISILTKAGVALSMTFRIEPLYSFARTEHSYLMLFEKTETVRKNLHVSVASARGEYSRHEERGGRGSGGSIHGLEPSPRGTRFGEARACGRLSDPVGRRRGAVGQPPLRMDRQWNRRPCRMVEMVQLVSDGERLLPLGRPAWPRRDRRRPGARFSADGANRPFFVRYSIAGGGSDISSRAMVGLRGVRSMHTRAGLDGGRSRWSGDRSTAGELGGR
jgi:PAS domain S-box-containing protein